MMVSAWARRRRRHSFSRSRASRRYTRASRALALRSTLTRSQSLQNAALALALPGAQVRGVQPLTAQQCTDLSRLTPISFLQAAQLVLGRELAPAGFLHYLRIGPFGARGARSSSLSYLLALPSVISFLPSTVIYRGEDVSPTLAQRADPQQGPGTTVPFHQCPQPGRLNRLTYHPRSGSSLDWKGLISVEALLRWEHPDLGLVFPSNFLPFAEESGLIVPIGQWALEEACRRARTLAEQGLGHLHVDLTARRPPAGRRRAGDGARRARRR